jgi:uncharacterized protein (DUF1330 family)
MPAYLLYVRHEITDEAKSRRYSELVVRQVREFGGEIVATRGHVTFWKGIGTQRLSLSLNLKTKMH